jgi:hypothetical protein
MGHAGVEGLLNGDVYCQVKIDGANLTVALDSDRGTVVASRNQVVSLGGNPDHGFNGSVEYVLGHQGIYNFFEENPYLILRGEWLVRHTINYPADVYKQWYVFDVQHRDGTYLHPDEYIPMLEKNNIKYIPILARFSNPTLDEIIALLPGADSFGATQKEGLVIKNLNFVNRYGRITWGKIVSADFKEKNKLAFGSTTHDDPVELRFVAKCATPHIIYKNIDKIRDTKGEVSVRNMSELIQRVWYDIFQEELWDFVRNEKVKAFDFHLAKKLCDKVVRDTALAVFNGLPMINPYDKGEVDDQ